MGGNAAKASCGSLRLPRTTGSSNATSSSHTTSASLLWRRRRVNHHCRIGSRSNSRDAFRRPRRWRAGVEVRINVLKWGPSAASTRATPLWSAGSVATYSATAPPDQPIIGHRFGPLTRPIHCAPASHTGRPRPQYSDTPETELCDSDGRPYTSPTWPFVPYAGTARNTDQRPVASSPRRCTLSRMPRDEPGREQAHDGPGPRG